MLSDQLKQYIGANVNGGRVSLFTEEKEYAEKHQLADTVSLEEKDAAERFSDAYIERCDKEAENMIRLEDSSFLAQPLTYLNKHKNEFIYLESKWFDFIKVDAISIELDDVFGTYDVMLGLKLQKKYAKDLKEYLTAHLLGEEPKFDLMFHSEEGLWNLNFALNNLEHFNGNLSIGEAYQLIYKFLFHLMEAMVRE